MGSKNNAILFALLLLTTLIYFPSISHDFVSLDDDELITENPIIQELSTKNFWQYLTSHQMGHYLPITTLSYAIQYQLFGAEPYTYHLFSLFLHLLCGILVFRIGNLLKFTQEQSFWISAFFLLHPMNVESVAWISARSNVLSSLFYLTSIYSYIKYAGNKKHILSFVFFLLACLSKSSAVTLPVLFVLIDYSLEQKLKWKMILQKTPFFIVSMIFGLLAIHFSKQFGTLDAQTTFSWFEKPFLSAYAFVFYIFKYILPIDLSALHFFPVKNPYLPVLYYLSVPIVGLLLFLVWKYQKNKIIGFGFVWFCIHIFLVLQWLTIGQVFATERYTYLAYLGLSMLWIPLVSTKTLRMIGVFGVLIFSISTYQRTRVWKNSNTLYSDVILKYPEKGYGYYGKGIYFMDSNIVDSAITYFTFALEKEKYFPNALLNRGNMHLQKKEISSAINDYEQALYQKPDYTEAMVNLGYVYHTQQDYQKSIDALEKIKPEYSKNPKIWLLLAENYRQIGQKNQACSYYTRYISQGGEKISQTNYCD